jgi:hypothetical protein
MHTSNLVDRGVTLIKNLKYLPGVFIPFDKDAPYSEYQASNYGSWLVYAGAIRSAILPIYEPFRGLPVLPTATPEKGGRDDDDEKWFFLNGICTNDEVLQLNGKALADLFGRTIHLLHNPSDGILLDLAECAVGRTLQLVSTLDNSASLILEDALKQHKKVVLIAHSQGGIISTAALRILSLRLLENDRQSLLNKLEVYTFASAARELPPSNIYSEHFFNTRDYVARIGIATVKLQSAGKVFEHDTTGHLLNAHYLPHFINKAYKSTRNNESRLYSYMATTELETAASIGMT